MYVSSRMRNRDLSLKVSVQVTFSFDRVTNIIVCVYDLINIFCIWILRSKTLGRGSALIISGYGETVDCCQRGNETSCYIQHRESLTSRRTAFILRLSSPNKT